MISRRGLLKTGLLLGGATLVGSGLYCTRETDTEAIAAQLIAFLDQPEQAGSLGASLLKNDASLENVSLHKLTDEVLAGAGLVREKFPCITRGALLESLQQGVNRDFSEENIVLLDGWLLSRTEAHLCALLSLHDMQQPA